MTEAELRAHVRAYVAAWTQQPHRGSRPDVVASFFGAPDGYRELTVDQLTQLLDRLDFRAQEAEQLAEACARYRHQRDEARTRVDELKAKHDRDGNELRDKRNDLLNIRGILHPADRPDFCAVPLELLLEKAVAPAIEWLVKRVGELEAELAGFETVWGVRYGIAKTMDSEAEPDTYTTERESEADARLWRDDYAPHGEIVTCRVSPWRTVDEDPAPPAQAAG